MNTAGGIGAIGAAQHDDVIDEVETDVGIDLLPHQIAHDRPTERQVSLSDDEIKVAIESVHTALIEAAARLSALEASLIQIQGQHNQVEMALSQYANAINTHEARLNAIAQQIGRNYRLAALDAATKTAGPGLQTDAIITRAEAFLRWVDPPKTVDLQQAAPSLDEAEAVRH